MYNAILLTNKNETKCGLQIKTMLKCLFIFVDQNETKLNVISSRLVALLLLFCSISVSCVSLQGLTVQGCQVKQQNPPNCYSKLAQSHFEGGSPVKFAFQGLNITLLGSLQPADMKNNPRQK